MRRERPAPGLFTSIKLPEAEPPNGVAPLLDFPRGRMKPITFLGEGPHGNVSTTLKAKRLKYDNALSLLSFEHQCILGSLLIVTVRMTGPEEACRTACDRICDFVFP